MSEVADLMRRIELECEALNRAMNGYAVVSSHEMITGHYNNIGGYQHKLENYMSPDEADDFVCEIYNRVLK